MLFDLISVVPGPPSFTVTLPLINTNLTSPQRPRRAGRRARRARRRYELGKQAARVTALLGVQFGTYRSTAPAEVLLPMTSTAPQRFPHLLGS
jgi:hypothetical protein